MFSSADSINLDKKLQLSKQLRSIGNVIRGMIIARKTRTFLLVKEHFFVRS